MNYSFKYAKIVNDLVLDELDHIRNLDLLEWHGFN